MTEFFLLCFLLQNSLCNLIDMESLSLFAIKQLSIPEFTTQQMYMSFRRILQDTKDTLQQGQGFRVNFVTC